MVEEKKFNYINEDPHERFRRLASYRTNQILKRLQILGNCSNRHRYHYTEADIDKIFRAITNAVEEVRAQFMANLKHKKHKFEL